MEVSEQLLQEIERQAYVAFPDAEIDHKTDPTTGNSLIHVLLSGERRTVAVSETFLEIQENRELEAARTMLEALPERLRQLPIGGTLTVTTTGIA